MAEHFSHSPRLFEEKIHAPFRAAVPNDPKMLSIAVSVGDGRKSFVIYQSGRRGRRRSKRMNTVVMFTMLPNCSSSSSFFRFAPNKSCLVCGFNRSHSTHIHNASRNDWKNKITTFCCHNSEKTESIYPVLATTSRSARSVVPPGTTSTIATTPPLEQCHGIGIIKFLQWRNLLITGATGFLGKVLLEKVLRTVPDVGKIFILIKAKDREEALGRLKTEIMNSELFKCLKQIHGKSYDAFLLSKLVPVVGDVADTNLGMESIVSKEISEAVDVIINSAANTNFFERYDIAVKTNVRGPCQLLEFGKKCKRLCLFLHVSTAYVNGERRGIVQEKPFYKGQSIATERETVDMAVPVLDVDAEIKLALESTQEVQDNSTIQSMKQMGLERARRYRWQDTYAFTKAMGEMLMNGKREDIPVVIIRPSIIESSFRDPFPGWIQGNRMLDPLLLSYGKGWLPGLVADPLGVADVVPADMVVNAILAAVAQHGIEGRAKLSVYHVCSSVANPLTYGDIFKYAFDHFSSSPLVGRRGEKVCTKRLKFCGSTHELSSYVSTVMAEQNGFMDRRLRTKWEMIERNALHLSGIYEPYLFHQGRFDSSNTKRLMDEMSEEEKRQFGIDFGEIDWKDYFINVHIPGLRKHVLKGRFPSS
ncbi:Long-chain-fatty-acyl-CoA reductase [Bertholletia excelsa]